VESQFTGSSKA
jgi:hypothetical protein